MSYPPPPGQGPNPNNPYGQPPQQPGQPPQGQPPQPGPYGYPQQPPAQPGPYGPPPAAGYGYPQQPPVAVPGQAVAQNGWVTLAHGGAPLRLATMGQRFLARLLDGLIVGAVMMVISLAGVFSALGVGQSAASCGTPDYTSSTYSDCVQNAQAQAAGPVVAMLVMFVAILVVMALYEWLMIAFKGATFGKMALGLRVLRSDSGQLPGAGAGFVRYIIPVASALACYIGTLLVWLSPFFDNTGKQQGWHDKAANTVVVNIKG